MAATISATDTELQKPVNVIFQQTFLRQAMARCPYFVGSESAELIQHGGSATAKWRRYENISPSTTALAELTTTAAYGQGRDATAFSFTDVTATVAKYGQHSFITEEADLFNFSGQFDQLFRVHGIAAGRSANQLQRNIAEDNLTIIRAGGAASDGAIVNKIALTNIEAALLTLDVNSAQTFMPMTNGSVNQGTSPILPAFWAICHPYQGYDIAKMAGFIPVTNYAGQTRTAVGEIGAIQTAGRACRVITSEDATVDANAGGAVGTTGFRSTGGSTVDLFSCVIFGMNCLGSVGLGSSWSDGIYQAGDDLGPFTIRVGTPTVSPADPYGELTILSHKFWWAGTVLNSGWGRCIRSAATLVS